MDNREQWIASAYVANGFGKLAGTRYQYELSQTEEKKWKLWPVRQNRLNACAPIYGDTPKQCLEAARRIDEPELDAAQSA